MKTPSRLAFCGLGQMGAPMAGRLLGAGFDVQVWNRTPGKADPLEELGARVAATAAEAATGAEAVFTCVSDPEALEEVLFGEGGVVAGMEPGATLIDSSTVGPGAIAAVAARMPAGMGLLDAPVLGSVPQVEAGELQVFVGGEESLYRRWEPAFAHLGRPVYMGPSGSGAAAKMVANLVLGVLMTGLGEALALADGLGLDQAMILDILSRSPIGVTAKSKRDRIESGDYPPNFKLALARKDLGLIMEAAEAAGVDLRLTREAARWFSAAPPEHEGEDYSAVIKTIRAQT